MRIIKIPKKSGGERTIYAPNRKEKLQLQGHLPALNELQLTMCPYAHGFVPGRSVVTNARQHIGYEYTLCMDLTDFFDSVTTAHMPEGIGYSLQISGFPDGAARQGLPTSPALANIAAAPMDKTIVSLLQRIGQFSYTRYADDIAISFNDRRQHRTIVAIVTSAARTHQFKVNEKKTRLQWAGAGRRVICGIAIDNETGKLHATRKARRRLRAALHRDPNSGSARGLAEWCKVKLPTGQAPIIARTKVKCEHKWHIVGIRADGTPYLENHDENLDALVVAFQLGAKPSCRCFDMLAVMMGEKTGHALPGHLRNLARKWAGWRKQHVTPE